jgi:hypothetical protein
MKGLSGDSESVLGGREASPAEGDTRGEQTRACAACGARARRESALFCATCGRELGGGYFPTDSLRASYRFERLPRRAPAQRRAARPGREFMPRRTESGAAALALAFVTYALVPYLGILFCPGALLFGGVGLLRAWRSPQRGHARASALGLVLGLLVLCAQLLLWWVLYKVPEWARQSPF